MKTGLKNYKAMVNIDSLDINTGKYWVRKRIVVVE